MWSMKRWIITGSAAALLLAGGGVAVFESSQTPVTPADNIRIAEERFGTAPAMPTGDGLKQQLAQVQAQATVQATAPGTAPADKQKALDDRDREELLKQQITFAEHAPPQMSKGHTTPHGTGGQGGTPPPGLPSSGPIQ